MIPWGLKKRTQKNVMFTITEVNAAMLYSYE